MRTATYDPYGWPHQKARRDAHRDFVNGTLCYLCKRPMYRYQALDLDHVVPIAMGGKDGPTRLTHAKCNRSAGKRVRGRGRRRGGVRQRIPKW